MKDPGAGIRRRTYPLLACTLAVMWSARREVQRLSCVCLTSVLWLGDGRAHELSYDEP